MIGYGIASSLVHEVGHQGAALLGLVESLRARAPADPAAGAACGRAWDLWDRWISEIVADFWSISRIGIGSTLGLIGLVSLPRGFVFRPSRRRPAPDALGPGAAQLRHRRPPVPGSAVGPAGRDLAGDVPDRRRPAAARRRSSPSCGRPCRTSSRCWSSHRPARLRGRSLGEVLRNPAAAARGAAAALLGLGGGPEPDGPRAAHRGVRRARPGQGERPALARSARAGCCGG